MTTETKLHMIAATLVGLNTNDIENVINELDSSEKPDDITTVELAQLMRKVKPRVEKIETNWRTRLELEANKKSSETTKSGEFINNPEAA